MLVRILLPHLATDLPRGILENWLVDIGETAKFGDAICRVNVSERVLLRGTKGASSLLALSRRAQPPAVAYEEERGRFATSYEIIASEPVTIVRHLASAGHPLQVGDLLGLADTGPELVEHDAQAALDTLPAMRVIARLFAAGAD